MVHSRGQNVNINVNSQQESVTGGKMLSSCLAGVKCLQWQWVNYLIVTRGKLFGSDWG